MRGHCGPERQGWKEPHTNLPRAAEWTDAALGESGTLAIWRARCSTECHSTLAVRTEYRSPSTLADNGMTTHVHYRSLRHSQSHSGGLTAARPRQSTWVCAPCGQRRASERAAPTHRTKKMGHSSARVAALSVRPFLAEVAVSHRPGRGIPDRHVVGIQAVVPPVEVETPH